MLFPPDKFCFKDTAGLQDDVGIGRCLSCPITALHSFVILKACMGQIPPFSGLKPVSKLAKLLDFFQDLWILFFDFLCQNHCFYFHHLKPLSRRP